jgi:ABC-type ATPase involved in cell division
MFIEKIKLTTFEQFESFETTFDNMNFITGGNGKGKTTLAVDALNFALYGFTTKDLISDLPTRGKAKTCSVELLIEENGDKIRVLRHFPLKLSIWVNNVLQKLSTAEANKWITDRFGDRLFFEKFRLIDAYKKETDFLREGQVALKKIIFAGTDEMFNNWRKKLTDLQYEREKYNKDRSVIYKCYPSEKRLNILITNLVEISNSLVITNQLIEEGEKDLRDSKSSISNNELKLAYLNNNIYNIDTIKSSYDLELSTCQKNISTFENKIEQETKKGQEIEKQNVTLVTDKICYVCKRPLESIEELLKNQENKKIEIGNNIRNYELKIRELKDDICLLEDKAQKEKAQKVEEYKKQILDIETEQLELATQMKIEEEILLQNKENRTKLSFQKEQLQVLKLKQENRLKQKEFIYTENDVLIAKKAIEELDKMSSYYLVETVGSLEPIINSVLSKINYVIKFDVDIKGKFNILLTKNNTEFKYKDLSGGERLILQIAFKIALLLQQNKTGVLIADEGMSSFDAENLHHILTLFEDLPFQLIVILHRFEDFPEKSNIIKLGE